MSRHDYLPFGEELAPPGETDADEPSLSAGAAAAGAGIAAGVAAGAADQAAQGTLTIRDNIRQQRAVDIDGPCGISNAGACTHAQALTVSFSANDGTNWRASNVDLRIYGDMWITSAPFPYKGRRPVDRSVVNADTARAHEYNAHINVAIAAVTPVINGFLARTFRSQQEFQAAANQTSVRVSELFVRTLRDTQDMENNRR